MQFLANFLMGDGALFFNVKIKGEFASKTTYLFLELEVWEIEREREWVREIRDSAGSEILLLM